MLQLTRLKLVSSFAQPTPQARFTWTTAASSSRVRAQFRQGTVAFGPQHPAAHGILKLQMQLHGEVLRWVDPQFGYLHRGTEKLIEARNCLQSLPYFDRFDYVANLFQEHAFCLAVEALYGLPLHLTTGVQLARVLFDEISRILNHLLTLSATALDLSAMGPIFWAFEERESLMELCEQASGARMHTALYRPFAFDFTVVSGVFIRELGQFLSRCGRSLAGAFLGLLNNRSLKSRLSFVGQISLAKAEAYGITGLTARSCGSLYDLRLQGRAGYTIYRGLAFRVFLGRRGDNFDRFLLRVKEVAECFRLLSQCVQALQPAPVAGLQGPVSGLAIRAVGCRRLGARGVGVLPRLGVSLLGRAFRRAYPHGLPGAQGVLGRTQPQGSSVGVLPPLQWLEPTRALAKFTGMEALISHFRGASEGWPLVHGFTYGSVESPKGEVGVTLVGAGGTKPYRAKIRTPVSHNMHLIPLLSVGATFADFVATFCSLDIVMGEIDR